MSNITGVTDALNRTTNYSLDEFRSNTRKQRRAGRLEENLTYDLDGNLLEKKDQANRTHSFCYDTIDMAIDLRRVEWAEWDNVDGSNEHCYAA